MLRLKEAFGSKCGICQYSAYLGALDFHHLDPDEKDFTISSWRKSAKWANLVVEVKKCVLLCSNCHREVHAGLTSVLSTTPRFNTSFDEYRTPTILKLTPCLNCQVLKDEHKKFCSVKCNSVFNGKARNRVDWESIDLHQLIIVEQMPFTTIGKLFNVSDNAVRKQAAKRGIVRKGYPLKNLVAGT